MLSCFIISKYILYNCDVYASDCSQERILDMLASDLARMSLEEICDLYDQGRFPADLSSLSLSEIIKIADTEDVREDPNQAEASAGSQVSASPLVYVSAQLSPSPQVSASISDRQDKVDKNFSWREKLPNSNNTNVPLLLWRADENNTATVTLAFGLYKEEFNDMEKKELIEIKMRAADGKDVYDKFEVNLDFPKDEKLARKTSGLAGSGSQYLCTYCDANRNTVMDPPYSGDAKVSLTNNLLMEAAHYCQLNPDKRSQAELSKISLGTKHMPICSTDPVKEKPDALHLDINVTKQLVTIANRLFHHKRTGQPLKYNKTEVDKTEMNSSEALYHKKLRERIATLPEITQNPGNFAREFCDESNADFIKQPLPEILDTEIWIDLMKLWRKMRSVHKRKEDPSDDEVKLFKSWVVEFQEKFFSLKWVPAANQIHRLSHIAFFMQSSSIRSIGAYSLEGLEHGNFSTKDGEIRRIWKGNTKEGNKQLFRHLRFQSSPTLRNAVKQLEVDKRKQMTCSKCGVLGHSKTSKRCHMYGLEPTQSDETADLDDSQFEEVDQSQFAEMDDNDDAVGGIVSSDEEYFEETTVTVDENNEIITDENNQCSTS